MMEVSIERPPRSETVMREGPTGKIFIKIFGEHKMEAWRKDAYRIINQFLRLSTNAIEQPISKV